MTKQEMAETKRDQVEATRMGNGSPERIVSPLVDIVENTDGLVLTADLPGVQKDGLDIQVEGNVLTVQGRVTPYAPTDAEPIYCEYEIGLYARSFILGDEIDSERISADLNDGVLTLTLPKAEQARPRKIEVKAT